MTRALPFSSRSERRILHSPRGTIGYPFAYWAKRLYQQTIEEWRIFGQLSGDPNESDFASAIEQGFHSGGSKGALTKGIEARQAQRKTGYYSPYRIAELCADLGDKEQAFLWLNTAYQERDRGLLRLRTDFSLDPLRSDPRFAKLVRKVGCSSREGSIRPSECLIASGNQAFGETKGKEPHLSKRLSHDPNLLYWRRPKTITPVGVPT